MKDNRDSKRSDILRELKMRDTEQVREFDDIVKLAALLCEAPISAVNLFDKNRQWFKAKTGIEQKETTQELSFCNHTLNGVLVVEDATKDSRFMHIPMVTGPEHIRFYAGVPIVLKGESIGTLCVTGNVARALSQVQRFSLETLSNQVTQLLELRLQNNKLQDSNEELEQQKKKLRESNDELSRTTRELSASEETLRTSLKQISQLKEFLEISEKKYRDLVEDASDMIYELDATGRFIFVNNIMEAKSGYPRTALLQKYYWNLVHPKD